VLKVADFKRAKINYSDSGKGRVIVLLHGFMESLDIWDDFSAQLSKTYRVLCIDLPGFGQSPCIGYVHSMELLAQCVKSVLDKEGLRRYVLIGHSMGGYAAMAFADFFPDNLKGLGLFHSSALADSEEKKKSREQAISVVKKDPRRYIQLFFSPLFAPSTAAQFSASIKALEKRAASISNKAIVYALEGMKDRKRRDWILELTKFPVLFIIGKHDPTFPVETILKQAELVKDPYVLLLENSGHMGFIEERDVTLKAVRKFVRKCYK